MNLSQITIDGREFEGRLSTKDMVALEKVLGTNPLNVLMQLEGGALPQIGVLVIILQHSFKENGKKLSIDKWYDLYDLMLAEGENIATVLEKIIEVFQVSGLIPEVEAEAGK